MKKTLLLAALAAGALTANAQSFSELFQVTYGDKVVENGGTVVVSEYDPDYKDFACDIKAVNISDDVYDLYASLNYTSFTTPEMIKEDPDMGFPQLCYQSANGGNCVGGLQGVPTNIGVWTEKEMDTDDWVIWQIHLNMNESLKTQKYQLVMVPIQDGVELDDSFSCIIEFNKDGAGVGSIEFDENAPVEYYDLTGARVAEPANGLYIKRQGNQAAKIML